MSNQKKIEDRRVVIKETCKELGGLMIDHYLDLDGLEGSGCDYDRFRNKVANEFKNLLVAMTETRAGILFLEQEGKNGDTISSSHKFGFNPVGPVVLRLFDHVKKLTNKRILTELDTLAGDGTTK